MGALPQTCPQPQPLSPRPLPLQRGCQAAGSAHSSSKQPLGRPAQDHPAHDTSHRSTAHPSPVCPIQTACFLPTHTTYTEEDVPWEPSRNPALGPRPSAPVPSLFSVAVKLLVQHTTAVSSLGGACTTPSNP
jgi:hypothetical protein